MNAVVVSPASSSLQEANEFYESLGYKKLSALGTKTIYADNQMAVELNEDRFIRPGLRLYKENWELEIDQLEKYVEIHKTESGYSFRELNGLWIYLEQGTSGILLDDKLPPSSLGNFMGISLECVDFETSIKMFETLGFKITMGSEEGNFIVLASNLGIGISFMKPFSCPHKFINPSLTFFNGKQNKNLIKKVFDAGIVPFEVPTGFGKSLEIENLILQDIGGWGIFMFND